MGDKLKDRMSANRHAAVNEECARLNARSVVQRLEAMQCQLDSYKVALEQANARITQIQEQMSLQQRLATQIAERGRGPTVT